MSTSSILLLNGALLDEAPPAALLIWATLLLQLAVLGTVWTSYATTLSFSNSAR